MKTLLKVAGGIVVCAVLLLVILRFTGFEPGACPNPGASLACAECPVYGLEGIS